MIQIAEKDNFVPDWKLLSRLGRVLGKVLGRGPRETSRQSHNCGEKFPDWVVSCRHRPMCSALIMVFADVLFKCAFRQWYLQMCCVVNALFIVSMWKREEMPNCGRKTREIAPPRMVVDSYRGAHGRRRWDQDQTQSVHSVSSVALCVCVNCTVCHQLHATQDHCTVTVRHLDLGLHCCRLPPEYGASIHSHFNNVRCTHSYNARYTHS